MADRKNKVTTAGDSGHGRAGRRYTAQGSAAGRRRQSSGLLAIGIVILICCIGICIFLVLTLQATYRGEISNEFQTQHVTTGEVLNRYLEEDANNIRSIAASVEAAEIFDEGWVCTMMENSLSFREFEHIGYVGSDSAVYLDGSPLTQTLPVKLETLFLALNGLDYSMGGVYVGVAPTAVRLAFGSQVIISTPVQIGETVVGYFFSEKDLNELFKTEAFAYQTRMGECLVIGSDGAILAYSEGSVVVDTNDESFQLGALEYSATGEFSKRAVQELNYAIARNNSGFVTIRTRSGYRMQISYSPLQSTNHLFFVSCYQENLVDARIRPLIFISVLSCIAIVVLMICIIVYVWATAKRTNLAVERLAYEDSVTKGKNLNYFREFATETIYSSKETPFVIYRFDIANFRYINESYGHHRADLVLKSCVDRFAEIFSEKELCVRMTADQFLALLVNDSLIDKRLDEYRLAVNADARGNGIKYPIRFKTGIYQIKKHDHDIDTMIDHANVARKTLASDEKDATATYSERIVDNMRKVDHIESLMQKALADMEFKVYLQPKWDLQVDCITGAEALVRWVRPDGTLILPEQFIPIFENNGFVEQLDFFMLESVCERISELISEGVEVLPVSVNQSRLLLHSPDYVENVAKIIQTHKVPPELIELEITETVFEDEREEMIEIIRELKKLGVRLSMDDFGSGYSSLNMLKDVPFDVVKIDREFFSTAEKHEESRWIMTKIVEMINGLGMETVCEGVESEEQIEFLRSIGCRMVQGFYYSRPIPEPEFLQKYYKV